MSETVRPAIWKYKVLPLEVIPIRMSEADVVLSVVARYPSEFFIYVEVHDTAPFAVRWFCMMPTGDGLSAGAVHLDDLRTRRFIGTVVSEPFVWHLYEIEDPHWVHGGPAQLYAEGEGQRS